MRSQAELVNEGNNKASHEIEGIYGNYGHLWTFPAEIWGMAQGMYQAIYGNVWGNYERKGANGAHENRAHRTHAARTYGDSSGVSRSCAKDRARIYGGDGTTPSVNSRGFHEGARHLRRLPGRPAVQPAQARRIFMSIFARDEHLRAICRGYLEGAQSSG